MCLAGVGFVSIAWHVHVRSIATPLRDMCISMETKILGESARRLCVQRTLVYSRQTMSTSDSCITEHTAGPHTIVS